jgi:predicted metal-dependent enzyme (double-stranded beta helix superfamily)
MPDPLQAFIDDVELVLGSTDDEHEITRRLADRLSALLSSGYRLPPEFTRPSADHHVTYPLHIDPEDRWSMVSVVWGVGQRTPVHSHETWGVAGVYAGAERETQYVKPAACAPAAPLEAAGEALYTPGQVTVCCTSDDDVHSVEAVGTEPTVGIHVYGGNIGTLRRRSYDPATGEAQWFVSGWQQPTGAPPPVW